MKAGVEGRVQMRQGLQAWVKEQDSEIVGHAVDAAYKAGMSGRDTIRRVIWNTPSSLSHTPKDNRIWSGHMHDRADFVVRQRGNQIEIQFGWLGVKKNENYIGIQEYGGDVNGKTVTAMDALGKAMVEARRVLRNEGFGS